MTSIYCSYSTQRFIFFIQADVIMKVSPWGRGQFLCVEVIGHGQFLCVEVIGRVQKKEMSLPLLANQQALGLQLLTNACNYWPMPTCRQQYLHPSTTGRDGFSWEEASKETDSAMKSENKWLLRHLFSLCAENTQWKHEMQHARRVLLLIIYDFINILL